MLTWETGVSKIAKKVLITLWTASQAKACKARWKRRWMTFCQRSSHRKCQHRGVGGQKNPKSCQRSLWTAPKACEARWKRRWMTSIGKILVYYLHTWASKTWFRSQPSKSFLSRHTVGPNNQKHAQKLDSKKLWNWPIILISANSLTHFWYESIAMTGNGNYVNLLKTCVEKIVKSHQVNLFLAGFSLVKPL